MDLEGWGKIISLVGFPIVTLGVIAYAVARVAKWLAPIFERIGEKVAEFFSAQSEFVRGTETRLTALEKSQSQVVLQVNDLHVELIQKDPTRRTRILDRPVDPNAGRS